VAKVERRGNGSYETRVNFVDPLTKKRRQLRVRAATKRECERKATALKHTMNTGMFVDPGPVSVESYLEGRWLPHIETRVKLSTFKRYLGLVRRNIIPVLGPMELRRVRPEHVQLVIDAVVDADLSTRTAHHAYRVFSGTLAQAVRWQLIPVNPAKAITPPRVERPELFIPDAELVRTILAATSDSAIDIHTRLAAQTGLRPGELLGLRWREDVDLEAGQLHVSSAIEWHRGRFRFVEPKTKRARRTIPLSPSALRALQEQRTEQNRRRLLLGPSWHDTGVVLDDGAGLPQKVHNLASAFARLRKRHGLPPVRFYDLRHAFATQLLHAGVNVKVVSELMGHSSVAFTLDTYAHVLPGMSDEAAVAIERAYAESGADGK
jgi:integrase